MKEQRKPQFGSIEQIKKHAETLGLSIEGKTDAELELALIEATKVLVNTSHGAAWLPFDLKQTFEKNGTRSSQVKSAITIVAIYESSRLHHLM
jgi:hypothetical protein